jgi:tetratricopeptide (TPR) repeat protein
MAASFFGSVPDKQSFSVKDAEEAMQGGRYEEAVKILRECLRGNSGKKTARQAQSLLSECYARLGNQAFQAGDWASLSRWMQEAVEEFPHYPDFHYNLAVALRRQGKPAEALHHIEKSLAKNPGNVRAILYQGILWYELGQVEEGLRRIEDAVSREPALYSPVFEKAKWMHLSGNAEAALVLFESMEIQTIQDSRALMEQAETALREGRYSDAVLVYKKIVEMCPDYPDIRCRYAQALIELGQYGAAQKELQVALEKNPRYPDALFYLALTLLSLGQRGEARITLQRLKEIDPYHPGFSHPKLQEFRESLAED